MQSKTKLIVQNFLLTCSCIASSQSAQSSGFVPTASTPTPLQTAHTGYRHYSVEPQTNFYEFFEPACYSGKSDLTINFLRLKTGTIIFGKSKPEIADKKDEFYCQQAVSDAMLVKSANASQLSVTFPPVDKPTSSHDCAALLFNKYGALQNKTVAMHIIPPSVSAKFPGMFTEAELHSLKNLVGLDAKFIDTPDLTFYRAEWADYLSTADPKMTTRTLLIRKAEELLTRYKRMFFYLDTVLPLLQPSYSEKNATYDWIPNPYRNPLQPNNNSEQALAMRQVILSGKVTQHEKERLTRAARDAADHGNYGLALKYFEQFRDLDKDASLISEEVICLEKLHQREKVVALLKSMIRSEPEEIKVYEVFVGTEIEANRLTEALALCDDLKNASSYDSDNIALLRTKVLLAMKDKKAAGDVLLERYLHNMRAGEDNQRLANALNAMGVAKPDKAPEKHDGDNDALKSIGMIMNLEKAPNGRELCCLFKQDFENNQPGRADWYWRHDWHRPALPITDVSAYAPGASTSITEPQLTLSLNLDFTYVTSKMLADKFAVSETVLTDMDINRDVRFLASTPRLHALNKKIDGGGVAFLFSAIDPKQLLMVTRYWSPYNPPALDYHETDFIKHVETVKDMNKNGRYKEAKELIAAHWNDHYIGLDKPEAKRSVLEQKRELLLAAYQGERNDQVVAYLKAAPLAYITQDLANRCVENRLPSRDEYLKNKWFVRGDVPSADSKNAYYQIGKAGYPCIKVNAGTPLFKAIYPVIGDTLFWKTALINTEVVQPELFDDQFYASNSK